MSVKYRVISPFRHFARYLFSRGIYFHETFAKIKPSRKFLNLQYITRIPGCITAMVEDIGWESLQNRRCTARLSFLHKIQHGQVDIESSCYLRPNDNRTGGQRGLLQERIDCDVHFNSFFPRTTRDCNELPRDITGACTLEEFQTSLVTRLMHA